MPIEPPFSVVKSNENPHVKGLEVPPDPHNRQEEEVLNASLLEASLWPIKIGSNVSEIRSEISLT